MAVNLYLIAATLDNAAPNDALIRALSHILREKSAASLGFRTGIGSIRGFGPEGLPGPGPGRDFRPAAIPWTRTGCRAIWRLHFDMPRTRNVDLIIHGSYFRLPCRAWVRTRGFSEEPRVYQRPAGDPYGFEPAGRSGTVLAGPGPGWPSGTRGWTRAEPYASRAS
ncbi:hypothetical protein DFH09DRAFT_1080487 [Mycena vulgaris]|nr:hypothetical protein DFH09DRAFT_1080487 [Mycena vulgaris]